MKKFFSLILLTLSIASLSFGMEENSNNNNESVATVITSDRQEFPINNTKELEALKESITIANFLEFLDENEKVIALPEVTSDQFNKVLPLLTIIHENKLNPEQARQQLMQKLNEQNSNKQSGIKEGKQEEDEPTTIEYTTEEIVTLFNTADYLDVPLLLDCCTELLAEKLITSDELKQFIENPKYLSMLDQLPTQLNRALTNKIPTSHLVLSKKLGLDFTHQTLNGHTNEVRSVAFSPDGRLLASASSDNTVNIYTIDQQNNITHLTTLNNHNRAVNSVAFSPDGRLLASASGDHTVNIYAIDQQNNITHLTTLNDHDNTVFSVAFSPDGRLLASASNDHTVNIYAIDHDQQNNITHLTTLNHNDMVISVAFSPDGRLLASASVDHTVNIYTIDHDQQKITDLTTLNHNDGVFSVAFSPDGRLLASTSHDHTVNIYAIDQQNNITHLTTLNHNDWVFSVAFSPDGRLLASVSYDHTVNIYAIDQQNNINHLTTLNDWVSSVAFSPNGRLLASASHDHTVNVYDLSFGNNLLIEPLLLLAFCINDNQSIDLKKHPRLQPIFDSLPEAIKNKLIEKEFIILPLSNIKSWLTMLKNGL